MKKAVEKALYYTATDTFNNNIIEFVYIDEKSFQNILKNLSSNLEVVATFNKDDFQIFDAISKMYGSLLFNKTTSLYIVNRRDISIKLTRKIETEEKVIIGVIKLDAVLAEYSYPSFLYPFIFGTIAGTLMPILYFKLLN